MNSLGSLGIYGSLYEVSLKLKALNFSTAVFAVRLFHKSLRFSVDDDVYFCSYVKTFSHCVLFVYFSEEWMSTTCQAYD